MRPPTEMIPSSPQVQRAARTIYMEYINVVFPPWVNTIPWDEVPYDGQRFWETAFKRALNAYHGKVVED